MPVKVAVVQAPPVLLDRAATIARMLQHMADVAAAGAKLVVFPEAYIPGYPTWVWRLKPGADMALAGEIHAQPRGQSLKDRDEALAMRLAGSLKTEHISHFGADGLPCRPLGILANSA